MPIVTVRVIVTNNTSREERLVCVVDGQAYYCSSGGNSQMQGLWFPFEGVEQGQQFAKPEIATGRDDVSLPFKACFPSALREAIGRLNTDAVSQMGEINRHHWGRFKSMECLYVSCLLSPKYAELRRTMQDYVGVDSFLAKEKLDIDLHPDSKDEIVLSNESGRFELNAWLNNHGVVERLPASQQEEVELMARLEHESSRAEDRPSAANASISDYPAIATSDFKTYVARIRNEYSSSVQQVTAHDATINPMHPRSAHQRRGEIQQEGAASPRPSSCFSSIKQAFGLAPRDAMIRQETSSARSRWSWGLPTSIRLPSFSFRRNESDANSTNKTRRWF